MAATRLGLDHPVVHSPGLGLLADGRRLHGLRSPFHPSEARGSNTGSGRRAGAPVGLRSKRKPFHLNFSLKKVYIFYSSPMAQPGRDTSVKTRDLRSSLAEVLGQVERGGRVIVEKYNDPVAAIIPMSDYLTLRRLCATRADPSDKEPRMAHRIVTSNISGGEGKTSITRELALTLADQGYRVAIIDTDPQGSLTKNLGLHDPVEGVARADLPGYRREHTILSVFDEDTEPRLGPRYRCSAWTSGCPTTPCTRSTSASARTSPRWATCARPSTISPRSTTSS